MNLLDIFEGREPHQQAIDELEKARIDYLKEKLDYYAEHKMAKEFKAAKDELESYFKIKEPQPSGVYKKNEFDITEPQDECMGYGGLGEAGIGQDIANKTEKMARATPGTPAGKVASTVKNAAKWLAGKGGPGKEGPTYEGAGDIEDRGEYDQEGDMLKDNLHTIRREADRLEQIISNSENVPEWVQDKLAQVKGMITSASEYMQTQRERDHEEVSGEEGITVAEAQKKNSEEVAEAGGGWALDPKTRLELQKRKNRQKTIAKYAGKNVYANPEWTADELKALGGPRYKDKEIKEAQQLHIGDPIVVTAPNEFEGKTGEISDLSPSGRFVVVDLYNHGRHSMHLSDITYNEYADQEQEDKDDWYDDQEDTMEGSQDFNKVEPYAVCLAGKPVKKFDYYADARRFHDNWKKKLYNAGEQAKADKITLMPLNLDEASVTKKPQPYNKNWTKDLTKDQLNKLAGPRYKKPTKQQGVAEAVNPALANLTPDEIKGIGMMIQNGHDIPTIIRIFDNKPTAEQITAIATANMQQGVAEGDDLTHAGQDVMVWTGPPTNNPPRDDKKYWIRGKLDSTEMHNGSMRANVMTAKGMYNPELSRVFNADMSEAYTPSPAKPFRNPPGFNKKRTAIGNRFADLNRAELANIQPSKGTPVPAKSFAQGIEKDLQKAMAKPKIQVKKNKGVAEGSGKQLSVQQLATISDAALDSAYGYGRSQPGNTFGWQANLKSAAFAKQMIDKGITDVESISDAIHKGWNVTAQAFVKNPMMFDDSKTMAPEKLQAKVAQRQKLMTQQYAQLPEDEKEKDRVVARAMLQAITGGQQGVAEASYINGHVEDPESLRWKQTSMSYEQAVAKFGKNNVKQDGKNRLGQKIVMVLVPLGEQAETDYSKRRQRERDVDAGKPVAKPRQPRMTDYQKRRAQQKREMELGESQDTSGVERAILNRIMVAHTDLLMKFGPEKVMQAAEEVAYNVGDLDEIGTSDVSAWVHEVKRILGA